MQFTAVDIQMALLREIKRIGNLFCQKHKIHIQKNAPIRNLTNGGILLFIDLLIFRICRFGWFFSA